jgi:hypothetical protein
LRSCFRTPQQAEYTLQGPPQLIDLGQKLDQELLTNDSASLFSYFFKHVRDTDVYPALKALPADQIQAITQYPSGFYTLKVLMAYYKVRTNTQEPLKAFRPVVDKFESDQQRKVIMTIGEALLQQGLEEGWQEGVHTVAANMIQQGMSDGSDPSGDWSKH